MSGHSLGYSLQSTQTPLAESCCASSIFDCNGSIERYKGSIKLPSTALLDSEPTWLMSINVTGIARAGRLQFYIVDLARKVPFSTMFCILAWCGAKSLFKCKSLTGWSILLWNKLPVPSHQNSNSQKDWGIDSFRGRNLCAKEIVWLWRFTGYCCGGKLSIALNEATPICLPFRWTSEGYFVREFKSVLSPDGEWNWSDRVSFISNERIAALSI